MRLFFCLLTVGLLLAPEAAFGQRRGQPPRGQREQDAVKLPADPRLVELHREFVTKAEKLGDEYARRKDWEKARVVFGEVLKLVPNYPPAVEKLKLINSELSSANQKLVTVDAAEGWQDTGIEVEEGSPLTFQVEGEWMFVYIGDANGIEIPREIRDFKLGSLIGIVSPTPVPSEDIMPFTVGTQMQMTAPASGRLLLKMHDFKNEDNRGQVRVQISGSFK